MPSCLSQALVMEEKHFQTYLLPIRFKSAVHIRAHVHTGAHTQNRMMYPRITFLVELEVLYAHRDQNLKVLCITLTPFENQRPLISKNSRGKLWLFLFISHFVDSSFELWLRFFFFNMNCFLYTPKSWSFIFNLRVMDLMGKTMISWASLYRGS